MKDQPTTTVKLYKEDVEIMKAHGKYGETLADITHRLFVIATEKQIGESKGNDKALCST